MHNLKKIEDIIFRRGNYTRDTIRKAIDLFYYGLGINDYYFKTTPIEIIAAHIEALKAAEIIYTIQREKMFKIDLATELKDEAIYLVDDNHQRALEVEKRIEERYPHNRLQSYRTQGRAFGVEYLRMYFIYKPEFILTDCCAEETDLKEIASQSFLQTTTKETYDRYQGIITRSRDYETPLIEASHKKESKETRIMVAIKRDSSSHFFSNVSDVIQSYGLVSNRKYVEQFNNGKTIYAFYLDEITDKELIQNLMEDISLVYVIPESPLSNLFREGKLNVQETVFGVAAWSFAHQFLSEYNEEYLRLVEVLKGSPELIGLLRDLKTRLAKESYDGVRVWDSLTNYHEYVKKTFALFEKKFNPLIKKGDVKKEITQLEEEIKKQITVEIDRQIFLAIVTFIKNILRTNFYKREKTSLSFMLSPEFLNKVEYPQTPFGIFFILGIEFRGFHIRFRDIARGGIRIVTSNNLQNYLNNSDFIFDENYNLAHTQQKKNKDIPEGGSKGTILLNWPHQDKAEAAFKKYINGLLDLLLPDSNIKDYKGKEVILFLGPDEGTADFMEWAALRAKAMDYPYWKSFSTGKPLSMGGIPHDIDGMTTNSVHQYVLKMLHKKGLKESEVTKVMTGGPDGDLGSNEILISKDKILAIIDGSGVLYDPHGLDRKELDHLAKQRLPVEHFNHIYLSKQGFLVTIEDRNVTLPDGEQVENGLEFRNLFHLNPIFKADLFVPCGGRPGSININNWTHFVDKEGNSRFKFISEGANLFITQEARLRLEERGVIIYKDASANKGGVTSSSLEVYAGLSLTDREYQQFMHVKENSPVPAFREQYIRDILKIIRENAVLEFEVIWEENRKTKIPRSILSDLISEKINRITDSIYASDLFSNEDLFRSIIECCCPSVLIKKIGFEQIIKRIPDSYLKAIFASRLASRFVYKNGLDTNEIDFYEYIKNY